VKRYLSVEEACSVLAREGRQVGHVLELAKVSERSPQVSESAWSWLYRRLGELTNSELAGLHVDTFVGDNVMRQLLRHQRRHIRWRLPGLRGENLSAAVAWSNLNSGPMSRIGSRMQRMLPDAIIIARGLPWAS
jgi:hypothetical protein